LCETSLDRKKIGRLFCGSESRGGSWDGRNLLVCKAFLSDEPSLAQAWSNELVILPDHPEETWQTFFYPSLDDAVKSNHGG
jgi:hypothetical protein